MNRGHYITEAGIKNFLWKINYYIAFWLLCCRANHPFFLLSQRPKWKGMNILNTKHSWKVSENCLSQKEKSNQSRGKYRSTLQYSFLENSMDRRSLEGYSQWGCKVGHNWGTHIRTFPDSPNTLHLGSWFLFFCMLFAICTYWWFLKLCPVTAAASLRVFLSLLHCQLLHLGPGPHLSHLDHWICLLIGLPHSRLASPPHPTS